MQPHCTSAALLVEPLLSFKGAPAMSIQRGSVNPAISSNRLVADAQGFEFVDLMLVNVEWAIFATGCEFLVRSQIAHFAPPSRISGLGGSK